jgi:hypothetical protein
MSIFSPEKWSVEILEGGRSGSIGYEEPAGLISFYWEFGGGKTVVIIWVDDLASWKTRYPWAAERRREIMERVAREVIRQKAPSCTADIDESSGYIHIRESAA